MVGRHIPYRVRDNVAYVPGSTGVQTSAQEAWDLRKGVCQDIAHLTVGLLRGVGIPSRYVSGYLHPRADAQIGETVEGQSHAWVEWWCGGWEGYDRPTAYRRDRGTWWWRAAGTTRTYRHLRASIAGHRVHTSE